jgi:hypothetical protein
VCPRVVPVQDEAIPLILGGGDVLIAAETGSGKTGAFGIPLLQTITEALRGEADVTKRKGGAAAAGGGSAAADASDNRVVMSAGDRDLNVAISSDGLVVQSRDEKGWGGCRASTGFFRGRLYFEATVTDEGLCRVGWSTKSAAYDIGTDNQSFGFGGTGKKSHNRQFDDYGEKFGLNDVIGCSLDIDSYASAFARDETRPAACPSMTHFFLWCVLRCVQWSGSVLEEREGSRAGLQHPSQYARRVLVPRCGPEECGNEIQFRSGALCPRAAQRTCLVHCCAVG